MGGHIRDFGAAQCVGLENGLMSCEIITYGGALRSLTVPDRTGRGGPGHGRRARLRQAGGL